MLTLYYAPGAASLSVHWLLIELDLPHRLVQVDLEAGAQKQLDYLALNPAGVVPTLIDDGGRPRTEAAALLLWLAEQHPQCGWAPLPGGPDRIAFVQWMFHLANAVQPLLRLWWYPHEAAGAEHADAARYAVIPRIEAAWRRIDACLAQTGSFLLGARPSAADLHLVMLMRWSRHMPRPATDWPHLARLADAMCARPAFATLCAREGLGAWQRAG